jgi:leader peptidase (prepilin peptidase)/N-methyltransferase
MAAVMREVRVPARENTTRLLLSAGLFVGVYLLLSAPAMLWRALQPSALVASTLLAGTLGLLSAIDVRDYRLPDALTMPLAAFGLLVAWWMQASPVWWHAASAVVGFGALAALAEAYRHLRGRDGLGLGDAKLLAASGAWLGVEGLPTVLLWASGSAIVAVLVSRWHSGTFLSDTRIPFGPFLAFGTWLVWLYGPV